MGGSSGAYTHSQGLPSVRSHVADYISNRDGFPADPKNIFLTAGASPGVQMVIQSIILNSLTGIMIPIPQYPLYTASIALYGGTSVKYYLDESNGWAMSLKSLQDAIKGARKGICKH